MKLIQVTSLLAQGRLFLMEARMKSRALIVISALFVGMSIGVIMSVILFNIKANTNPKVNHYPLTTVVSSVEHSTDTVEVEDGNGTIWAFTGCEDWQIGDTCSLIMSDNGTANIYDDEIVKIKYSSFTIRKGE